MKRRDQLTSSGNKKKSQRKGGITMGRLRSKIFVVGAAILVQLMGVLTFAATLFAQELYWAKSAVEGTGNGQGFGIAVDLSGNSYVTGVLAGNVFVAKYDNTGNLVWSPSAGGVGNGTGQGIAYGSCGPGLAVCSYVTGELGGSDLFVAKYDSNGALVWVKSVAGTREDCSAISQPSCLVGKGIGVDGFGNSYVAGRFQVSATKPTIIFGLGELPTAPNEEPRREGQTPLTSSGGSDIFVAKYDSNGALVWARNTVGPNTINNDQGFAIAVDSSGNSWVTGVTGTPGNDVFLAKYDNNGTLIWATTAGGGRQ
jgi:hypothetical protein